MGDLLCIGHRGAMGHAPENTLASFGKALELGANCIELDVYLVENQLIVFHDNYLQRTTNGQGLVMDQPLAYLRSLDAGQGETIPTLDEVCDLVDAQAGINIELKGPETAESVVRFYRTMLTKGWQTSQILISSFDRQQLQTCRMLDDEIMLGVLFTGPLYDQLEFAAKINAFALHPSLEFTSPELIQAAHRQGLKVFVFTVNESDDIDLMAKFAADGIFTKYPEKVAPKTKAALNSDPSGVRVTGFK